MLRRTRSFFDLSPGELERIRLDRMIREVLDEPKAHCCPSCGDHSRPPIGGGDARLPLKPALVYHANEKTFSMKAASFIAVSSSVFVRLISAANASVEMAGLPHNFGGVHSWQFS